MPGSLLRARKAILNEPEQFDQARVAEYARNSEMPELPEVEITARLIGSAIAGSRVESAMAPGVNALKTYDPPLTALDGRQLRGVRRRGKLFLLDVEDGLALLIHLMSAGRLQLFDNRASLRDRTSRLLLRLDDGRELRLREFGTKQAAWVKLLRAPEIEADETLAALGPDAWPDPPAFDELLDASRPLYALLRDQHVIAGIGRSWVDEILHAAKLSPFKRGSDLDPDEAGRLREATAGRLGEVIAHYQQAIKLPIPDKLPMPLTVHRRNGQPCPRCGDRLEAVFYEDYVMCYCPTCQTEGKLLKDRRLSRLLK
jgi:formamidopyrimidine-DNA glycosylase